MAGDVIRSFWHLQQEKRFGKTNISLQNTVENKPVYFYRYIYVCDTEIRL